MFSRKKSIPHSKGELVYKSPVSLRDYKVTFTNLIVYFYIFAIWMYIAKAYYNFGKFIITPAVAIILIVSAIIAFILPSQREEIIRDMKKGLAGYVTVLFGYRFVIMMISGVSSEDLSAAFNQSLPGTSGTAMLGWMQTILWFAAILTPIGIVSMQFKKISQFYGARKRSKAIREIRDFRDNQKPY